MPVMGGGIVADPRRQRHGVLSSGAATPTFDPTSVSTLLAGFSMRLSTFYQDSAGTTPAAADADPVAYASDLSGNARHFLQADDNTRRPLLKLNQVNGFSALRFDGSNDVIYNHNWLNVQPITVYVVCKQIAWGFGKRIISGGDNVDNPVINQYNTAQPNLSIYAGSSFVAENNGLALSTWGILEVVYNGASSTFSVNGGTATTGDPGPDGITDGVAVGGASLGALCANIDVAEVLVYDNLDAGERTTVRQGLGAVYGITVS